MQIGTSSFLQQGFQPGWYGNQRQGQALPGQEAEETNALDRFKKGSETYTRATEAANEPKDANGQELSDEDKRKVQELKKIDTNVKTHEAAHMSAGGGLVRGGASYEYQSGPDGQRYAVAGEVSIDTSPVRGDPQATIAKAQRIRQAAMAPADPSSQDRSVAAQAGQMAAEASMELAKQRSEEGANGNSQQEASRQKSSGSASEHQNSQQDQFMTFVANNAQHFKPSPGSLLHLSA